MLQARALMANKMVCCHVEIPYVGAFGSDLKQKFHVGHPSGHFSRTQNMDSLGCGYQGDAS